MSAELQEPTIEVTDPPEVEAVEVSVEEPKAEEPVEPKPFDPKTDKVEFDKPEQQQKFDYVFKNMKMSDNRNAMLTEFLTEQQKQLDDLRGKVTSISQEKTQENHTEASRVLMSKLNTARMEGND